MNVPLELKQRVGIIDLGSNSVRLMVVHYAPGLAYRITDEISRRVRLSEGMAAGNRLREPAMARAVQTVRMFTAFCSAHRVKRIVPVATAAVRDAENRAEFLGRLRGATGLRFRVLSGEDEARAGSVGVVNGIGLRDGLVLDVGGGSAEVSQVVGGRFRRGGTAALGAVRLTEMFLAGSGRAKPRAVAALEDHVAEALEAFGGMTLAPGGTFVGIGGTVRALARIDREARGYAFPLLNGYELKRSRLSDLVDRIAALPVEERPRRIPALPVDRADIILAGALTVLGALRWAAADRLTVCGHGLREGLFFAEFLRPAAPVVRRLREFSVFNLGRLCGFEPIHASHVTRLALSLYDQLSDRHGYGEFERGCLWAAGQLHDIGTIVEYYDHHKHSAYIILNAGLPGYSHRETAWIALLCLYHRKGQPALENLRLPAQAGDRLRANRLAALLRLAEYLDRSRTQSITRLRVTAADGRRVRLRALVRSGADGRVEIWEAQRNAGLFEQAFDCKLEIEAQ